MDQDETGAKKKGNAMAHRGNLLADIGLFKTDKQDVVRDEEKFRNFYGIEIGTWMDPSSPTAHQEANCGMDIVRKILECRASMSHMGSFTEDTLDETIDEEFGNHMDKVIGILMRNPELYKRQLIDGGKIYDLRLLFLKMDEKIWRQRRGGDKRPEKSKECIMQSMY